MRYLLKKHTILNALEIIKFLRPIYIFIFFLNARPKDLVLPIISSRDCLAIPGYKIN